MENSKFSAPSHLKMEQNTEVYERIIDRIIKIHKDSLKEIFGVIK